MLSSISILWVNAKRVFGKQDADAIVKKRLDDELLDARLHLLKAQTGLEYAQSEVTYQSARVARIRGQLFQEFREGNGAITETDNGPAVHAVYTDSKQRGKGWHRVD